LQEPARSSCPSCFPDPASFLISPILSWLDRHSRTTSTNFKRETVLILGCRPKMATQLPESSLSHVHTPSCKRPNRAAPQVHRASCCYGGDELAGTWQSQAPIGLSSSSDCMDAILLSFQQRIRTDGAIDFGRHSIWTCFLECALMTTATAAS
jgi:hypothetical protein